MLNRPEGRVEPHVGKLGQRGVRDNNAEDRLGLVEADVDGDVSALLFAAVCEGPNKDGSSGGWGRVKG